MDKNIKYIFVDLDGTLTKTDLLYESALKLLKSNPLNGFLLFIWLLQGKSTLKRKISARVDIDVTKLPYQEPLIDYLKEKKKAGHILILATASHMKYAKAVADHIGIFDDVIATNEANNLKGSEKLTAMKKYANNALFSYAGDNIADKPIWREAASNILVNAPETMIKEAEDNNKADKIINTRMRSQFKAFAYAMRPHQWAKNVLIFVPLMSPLATVSMDMVLISLLAFISFSLCASGVYFLNDLLDLEADRQHKSKHRRPLASTDLSIPWGVVGALALPITAFAISILFMPTIFVAVLAFYYLLTNGYSFFIKAISTADVMTLAILYTLRVIAGGAATGIALSSWLMAFSVFIFVSLAYLKRYIEISDLKDEDDKAQGRGYTYADRETMFSLGTSTITAAVVILALYVNSEEVVRELNTPEFLWGLCLLVLYWGNRIWVGARRGKITDDPVVFAIKDKVSRLIGLAFIGLVLAATFVQL